MTSSRAACEIASLSPAVSATGGIRSVLRTVLLRNVIAYQLYQRLRGRPLTREQILQIQACEQILQTQARNLAIAKELPKQADERRPADKIELTALSELPHHRARLDQSTCVISCGLDWQYKDLRALWALKQIHGFSYYAVVYDLIPVRFPHFVIPGYVELLTDYFGELLWLADRTICISEATRRDWFHHAVELGAAQVPAGVFPLGCDLPVGSGPEEKTSLPAPLQGKRFALYVSTIEPRKNHRMLYEAWDECVRTKRVDPERDRLVFVGRRGWATDDLLREIETNPMTCDTIVLLHDVSDVQLRTLYRDCAFVVFPSYTEGFGLPLAEALGYGKLCISSDAGALAEIGGDLVMQLDPNDTLAWADTMARLMAAESEVDQWEARVRNTYRPISWDNAASHFFQIVTGVSVCFDRRLNPDRREAQLHGDFSASETIFTIS